MFVKLACHYCIRDTVNELFSLCVACVRVGCRVWARVEKNCFTKGIVTVVSDYVQIKLESGKKIQHKRDSVESFVPDFVPHITEVHIGSRVLAKWCNRLETFYSGTVTAVRGGYFEIRYDDGDRGYNELTEIRLLKQPEIQSEYTPGEPPGPHCLLSVSVFACVCVCVCSPSPSPSPSPPLSLCYAFNVSALSAGY